ncbi:MAG: hypothetical protein COA36_05695 [Desulfotalea sp.]|nr:MAG: hypothetical protein COA36_05695 [Desulfotalea sp.]
MPIITIKFKDKKIRDYPLAVGGTCTIGRNNSNDIIIDNLAVSGKHARIESVSTAFVIRDLQSTNGTFVNKKKISMHNLRHRDVLLIGKHELIFDRSDLMNKENNAYKLDDDKTRILDTTEYRKLIHGEPGGFAMPRDNHSAAPSLLKRIANWFLGAS